MKVAILFRGQLRYSDIFNLTFKSNILDKIPNADFQFFAHFWNETSEISSSEHKSLSNNDFNIFSDIFSPIELMREDQKTVEEIRRFFEFNNDKVYDHGGIPNGHGTSRISQFYSFYKSFSLLEEYEKNNGSFDLYINTRTDILFQNSLDFNTIDDNSLFVVNQKNNPGNYNWVNDLFFITKKRENMESLSKISMYLDQIPVIGTLKQFEGKPIMGVEEILSSYFNMKKINIANLNIEIGLSRNYEKKF